MSTTTGWDAGGVRGWLLLATLEVAVPIEVERMRSWGPGVRQLVASGLADVIAGHGDALLYGGKSRGERADCRAAFVAVARALAAAAYLPGGVYFCGRHWCLDHAACVAAGSAARLRV